MLEFRKEPKGERAGHRSHVQPRILQPAQIINDLSESYWKLAPQTPSLPWFHWKTLKNNQRHTKILMDTTEIQWIPLISTAIQQQPNGKQWVTKSHGVIPWVGIETPIADRPRCLMTSHDELAAAALVAAALLWAAADAETDRKSAMSLINASHACRFGGDDSKPAITSTNLRETAAAHLAGVLFRYLSAR